MTEPRNISIKVRLILLQLLTASIVLVFAAAVLILSGSRSYRHSLIQRLTSMAQLIGSNSEAAIELTDSSTAEEVLHSLEAEDEVVNAWIHDHRGSVFAAYARPGHEGLPMPELSDDPYLFAHGFLTLAHPILHDGKTIGTVTLRFSMERYRREVWQEVFLAFSVLVVGALMAVGLGLLAQRTIIMVTAFGRKEVVREAESEDLDALLTKPASPSNLFDTIIAVLAARNSGVEESKTGEYQPKWPQLAGARVLLVEDNEVNQIVARELLEDEGLNVTVAYDGQEALAAMVTSDFDVVLMDIQMPVMDGIETTRRIRENPSYAQLPIIALTADTMVGDRERYLEAGMSDHVPKPIETEFLFAAMARCLEASGTDEHDHGETAQAGAAVHRALPGLDTVAGLKQMGGRWQLYLKVLGKFKNSHERGARAIRTAFEAGSRDEAARLAHGLKGVSGTIGATDVYLSAVELGQALKSTDNDSQIETLLASLDHQLEQTIRAIRTLQESSPGPTERS